jgi:predicted acyltransferase (DUF342 family)
MKQRLYIALFCAMISGTICGQVSELRVSLHPDGGGEGSLVVQENSTLGAGLGRASTGDVVFDEDVRIHGDLRVYGDVKIDEDLKVKEDVKVGDNLTVDGKTKTESLEVKCQALVGCDLTVAHDLSVGNNLYVTHDEVVKGNLTVEGILDAGDIVISEIITDCGSTLDCDLFVVHNATIGNDLTVNNDATITNALDVGCDLTVGCNILMTNSTDAAHGNILKGGNRFLNNFGTNNTFLGDLSGNFTMTGTDNTGIGVEALSMNGTGIRNTALGGVANSLSTGGVENTALGYSALSSQGIRMPYQFTEESRCMTRGGGVCVNPDNANLNLADAYSTAIGTFALQENTTGSKNTAVGSRSGVMNTTGEFNTYVGFETGFSNKTGSANVVVGAQAFLTGAGAENTFIGAGSSQCNSTGDANTFVGFNSGAAFVSGDQNIIVGAGNLQGAPLFNSGSNNIYLGTNTEQSSETNIIRIGNSNSQHLHLAAVHDGTNTPRKTLFADFIGSGDALVVGQSVFGDVVGGSGIAVLVDSNGTMGTTVSSRRFKEAIESIDDELLRKLLLLRPVSFFYKSDPDKYKLFGLIAEEVMDIIPELVVFDGNGQPRTVRYEQLSTLLIGVVQKLVEKIDQETERNSVLERKVEQIMATITGMNA